MYPWQHQHCGRPTIETGTIDCAILCNSMEVVAAADLVDQFRAGGVSVTVQDRIVLESQGDSLDDEGHIRELHASGS